MYTNVIKACFVSTALLISFNSFSGPVSAYKCEEGSDSTACSKTKGIGKHRVVGGAAAIVHKKKSMSGDVAE